MPFVIEGEPSGLTFKELREEFVERGFEDLGVDSAKTKRIANAAYFELCEQRPWPFLAPAILEGTAPLEVNDLAHVLSFTQGDSLLRGADERELVRFDPSLTAIGSASRWYQSGGELKVWPADEESAFVVRYLCFPPELENDGDYLVVPSRHQEVVLDGMAIRGYKNRDNFEAAQVLRGEWERGVLQMVQALLKPDYGHAPLIQRTGQPGDYA